VMIPITEARFLTENFQFRFRNRASLTASNDNKDKKANVDHWNVDYIRLERNRFAADTVLRDVAFNRPLNSILTELTSLPWAHFSDASATVLDQNVGAWYRNNDTIARNVTRSLLIQEPLYGKDYTPALPTAQVCEDLVSRYLQFREETPKREHLGRLVVHPPAQILAGNAQSFQVDPGGSVRPVPQVEDQVREVRQQQRQCLEWARPPDQSEQLSNHGLAMIAQLHPGRIGLPR
jgi:hypothetical protein